VLLLLLQEEKHKAAAAERERKQKEEAGCSKAASGSKQLVRQLQHKRFKQVGGRHTNTLLQQQQVHRQAQRQAQWQAPKG
jgi:hypothetical protein